LRIGGLFLYRAGAVENGASTERSGDVVLVRNRGGKVGERLALLFDGAGEAV
jgi:hypothetical protein